MLTGGIELYNLAVIETSALNNVCEVVRLDDLKEAEAVALIRDGLALIGLDAAVGTELGQALYARVRGHPYLTQRIGAALATQFQRGSVPDIARVEALCQGLLETDDPLLGHLRRGVAELRLAEAVRWLLTGTQRITRTDDATARLELLGLARRERGCWQPRNPLFALALAEWLHIAWPAHHKRSSVQAFKRSSVQAFKRSSVRAFKRSSVQALTRTAVKRFKLRRRRESIFLLRDNANNVGHGRRCHPWPCNESNDRQAWSLRGIAGQCGALRALRPPPSNVRQRS